MRAPAPGGSEGRRDESMDAILCSKHFSCRLNLAILASSVARRRVSVRRFAPLWRARSSQAAA
jgi:hypothetical protein